ncbi:hypothetical protein NM208_g772 [Fusarium decemcellulare]|uniref:Uncharacterized protein n=2 Tax=Fusarium decemcellulare TaxID=57161 RepID=A0ACC1SYQ3_9HYPO|nr:hypothetical protein NM208_g1675 [Fusarium decemcellulare]KAJ3548925.1 hypothetical protein NM208_g772 [Fusarium decemcellulare]
MSPPNASPGTSLAPSLHSHASSKPTALACIECRRKHVKCDAKTPQCLRCQAQGLECSYQASRRGLKKRKHHHQSSRSPASSSLGVVQMEMPLSIGRQEPRQIIWDSAEPDGGLSTLEPEATAASCPWSQKSLDQCPLQSVATGISGLEDRETDTVEDDNLLVNLFYSNFFRAHPFLVPHALYSSQSYPSYMKLVVHLIGCHYSGTICSETMQGLAHEALKKAWHSGKRNYFLVQALLLFSMILHARCVYDRSRSSLSQAVSLALELDMYRESFSINQPGNYPAIEESLRRTWWELYITDCLFAAFDHRPSFRCNSVKSDMPLPCEEYLYTGDPLLFEPSTVKDFESRIYATEDHQFSSFAYRIEACQLLARSLTIASTHELHRDQIQNVDNLLAAWPHHLEIGKSECLDSTGSVDQMLLQAHMLVQYTAMYLHFCRSDLVGLITSPPGKGSDTNLLPTYSRAMHGIKAVEAAKRFADLTGLEPSALKLTPLLLNGLLLSCTIQLSGCSLQPSRFHEQYYSRLCLGLGILRTLYPVWALAREVADSIKAMTGQVVPKEKGSDPSYAASLIDSGINMSSLAEVDITSFSWIDFSTQLTSLSEQS